MAIPAESMGAVKEGPWTPEEDLILVSYVQQHGPHNWDSVPKNAGLRRCGKSCRLRWSNYLRPGIKLGNFSRDEEKTIVNLQAVLGNKWSVIATHLPQRTDNDIKNYWNSHLKKKLQRQKKRNDEQVPTGGSTTTSASSDSSSSGRPRRGIWETRLQNDVQMARQALSQALASSPAASSTATPATATATVTPAAILPQGVQFSAQLMATPLLPSSAAGFMGGFKPPSNGSNRFTNPITSDHQLSTGPAQIQGSPSHHVFPADNMARLLQNMTKLPAPAAAFEEAISPDSVPSNVGSLSHPTIPDPLDAIVGLNYGKSNDNSSNLFGFYSTDTATFPDVMILEHQNFQVNASIKSTVVTNSSIPAPVNNQQPGMNMNVERR